jgi:outer membrane protein OmpA-like peptidoglycan-associated protein
MKFLLAGIAQLFYVSVYSQKTFTVYFDFNKYYLTAASRAGLDSFLRAEKENLPGSILHLNGYCDADGTDNYNDLLSVNRVNAVKNYLLDHGIRPGSIGSTKGHGEKDPLNENKTGEEKQLNRRVEISSFQSLKNNSPGIISLKEKIADSTTTSGTNIILRNINFYGGMHQFLPASEPMLNELLDAMRTYPKLVIRVEGHICCQQGNADGVDHETGIDNLSEARAKAVMDYLLANGIESKRVSFKGFGHSVPLYPFPERSEEERTQNRRVEIKIIKK